MSYISDFKYILWEIILFILEVILSYSTQNMKNDVSSSHIHSRVH